MSFSTPDKLEEAQYFLERFCETTIKPKINKFYLSAFLQAWRSVIDIMLYDFAEYFGFEYLEKPRVHQLAAIFEHTRTRGAREFIKWWRKKRVKVLEMETAKMRDYVAHCGLKLPATVDYEKKAEHSVFYLYMYSRGITVTVEECRKAFEQIKDIVDEAEKKFNVKLS